MRNEACDASEVPGPPSRSSVHHAVTLLGIYWECARTDGMFWRARCIDIQRLICWVFAPNHSSSSREISGLVMQCNNVASWMCRLGYRLIPVVNVVFMSASCVCARSTVGFAHSRQCGNALGAINASIYMAFLLVSVTAWVQRAISISFFLRRHHESVSGRATAGRICCRMHVRKNICPVHSKHHCPTIITIIDHKA